MRWCKRKSWVPAYLDFITTDVPSHGNQLSYSCGTQQMLFLWMAFLRPHHTTDDGISFLECKFCSVYLLYIYKCGKLILLLHEKVKDIYILYRGVQYCRMAYKVAQDQLRKLLEEVEEEDDFQNSEDRSSNSGSSSHVSGNKTV